MSAFLTDIENDLWWCLMKRGILPVSQLPVRAVSGLVAKGLARYDATADCIIATSPLSHEDEPWSHSSM